MMAQPHGFTKRDVIALHTWFDRMCASASWTDDAKAELLLLGMNLHDIAFQLSRQHPCVAAILEDYANRIDDLMKRAPEAVS